MKKTFNLRVTLATLLVAAPLASQATTFFTDYFTNSSTLNQPFAAATANSASYQTYIGLTNAGSVSALGSGSLMFVYPNTSGVLGDCLAKFSASPIALSQVGDYIDIQVIFVNASNILSTAAGVTMNNNASLNIGLFNSGGANPNQGQFQLSGGNITGGTEDWVGYFGRMTLSGNSTIFHRAAQIPSGTSSQNQDLLFTAASGSQAFNAPAGTSLGNTAGAVSLVQGSTNTLYLRITLTAASTFSISNSIFAGAGLGGAIIFSQERPATGANFIASAFDGFSIGWRNNSTPAQGSAMDIRGVLVSGISTVVTTPPDILTEPVAVTVPNGGSCAFNVVAQGFNMTYQWHRYNTNLVNGGNISGATSDTLIISPASAADVASGANGYYVTVTGTGGYSTNSTTNSLTLGTAKNLVWSGVGNVWDLNTTANWLDPINPANFNFGDSVTLDDTAAGGLRVITLTGKYLSASSVTVDGTSAYTFAAASTGGFAGPGKLNYIGANSLAIANANTYSGGTLISNSTAYLLLQNLSGLGTGPVTLAKAGGIMEVTVTGSASTGIVGDVDVQDDFTIQFDGTGSFAGVMLGNLSGTAGKTLTFNQLSATTTNRYRVYGANTVMNANLVVNGNASTYAVDGTLFAPYNASGSQTYNGVISGNGGLIQRGNGTTILNGQNTFTGGTIPTGGSIAFGVDSIPTSGAVVSSPIGAGALLLSPEIPALTGSGTVLAFGGARTIANPLQYPSATNNLTLIVGGTNALTFTGPCTLNGNDATGTQTNRTIQVNNTALTTISGVVSGSGFGLIKTGTGILDLTATETYTGATAISNGTLRVNGSLDAASAVTVASTGVLGGSGTVGGSVTVLAGGSIAPGNSIGTLNIGGNLTHSGNLAIEVNRSGSLSDQVNVTGTRTNAGTGTVTVSNLGAALQAGDTFTLFNGALLNGNALTVTGSSAVWTNKLAVNGTISVVTPISTTPTNISYAVSGNSLTLSWPLSHLTWSLQSNIVGVASSANWFTVPGSANNNQIVITVNPARSNVFYRMIAP
jgi:autotransporter-associated beta strand protein